VAEGQSLLSGDALLKIEDEKLPWVLDRQRAELKEAEAEIEVHAQGNSGYAAEDALEEPAEEEVDDAQIEYVPPPQEEFIQQQQELVQQQLDSVQQQQELAQQQEEFAQPQQEQEVPEEDSRVEDVVNEAELSPQERLARLRQRAMRARRLAAQQSVTRPQESQQNTERSEELSESRQALGQAKVDRIRAEVALTEKQLQGSTLASPIDGFVSNVEVTEGALVQPNDLLLEIITVDPIDLALSIPKEQVSKIDKSTSVKVAVPDLQGTILDGEISFIGAELDAEQKNVEIRVRVPNHEGKIKVGMEGTAMLGVSKNTHKAILVPSYAIGNEGGKRYVYIAQDQVAVRQEVETGSSFEGWVEIKRGVRRSDRVVTQGVSQLRDEEEFIKP
jgi:RND family efflux transporter MFP subunit